MILVRINKRFFILWVSVELGWYWCLSFHQNKCRHVIQTSKTESSLIPWSQRLVLECVPGRVYLGICAGVFRVRMAIKHVGLDSQQLSCWSHKSVWESKVKQRQVELDKNKKRDWESNAIDCIPGGLQIEGIFQRYMKYVVKRITLQEIEKKIREKKWSVTHLGL